MIVRSIRPEEFEEALDLLDAAFEHTPRAYFNRYFFGDPWFKPEYTRVVEEDGRLVSLVQIVRREVRVGCSTLVMGGIANVGTIPAYRGRGFSSAAMKSSVEVMAADGMHFGMLWTGINPFYERLGWATVRLTASTAKLKRRLPRFSTPYHVRAYRDDDAPAVLAIYDEFNSRRSLTTVRTLDYWRGFATSPESQSYTIWAAETGGQLAAYLAGRRYGESYGIAEMCCSRGHEDALRALAREAWAAAARAGAKKLAYVLPEEDSIRAAVSEVAVPARPWTYTNMMLRVIDLRLMFERMLPELERRSSLLERAGRVAIGTEFGELTLEVAPGRVTLPDVPADWRVELSQPQLFSLVFGLGEPTDILPAGPAADLLSSIFPRQPAVYYEIDTF